MTVLINNLANLPHHDGQIVLRAKREDFEVVVKHNARHGGEKYWVFGAVIEPGGGTWTNLAAERRTVQEARGLAARLWAEGEKFNVAVG
ncbi:MAG TPA: hypothetical protein VGN12_22750 [Pirellulales bacterium]|jgi:hypothetical protein